MTIAGLNLLLALATLALAIYIGYTHWRERGFRHPNAMLGLTVTSLVFVTVLSALGRQLTVSGISTDGVAFAAAFARGIAFVLLLSYALYKHDGGET